MNPFDLDQQEIKKIISFYRILSNFVFRIGIYILFCILGMFLIITLTSDKSISFASEVGLHKFESKKPYNGGYQADNIYMSKDIKFDKFDIRVLGGEIYSSGGRIFSNDNLVSISQILMPYQFSIENKYIRHIDIPKDYKIANIEFFVKEILGNNDNIISKDRKVSLIPLVNGSIKDTFDISCIGYNVITPFCKRNIDNFLDNLALYDISSDINGASEIYSLFGKAGDDYKDRLCKSYLDYNFHSLKFDSVFGSIYVECGGGYDKLFAKARDFANVNFQMRNNVISKSIYDSSEINIYKLLSIQKMLLSKYSTELRIDYNLLDTYLSYAQALIQQDIPNVYYDILYIYDNKYIRNFLKTEKVKADVQLSKRIQDSLDKLDSIDRGNDLLGYRGLNGLIVTKGLIGYYTNADESHGTAIFDPQKLFRDYISVYNNYILTDIIQKDQGFFMTRGVIELTIPSSAGASKKSVQMNLLFKYDGGDFKLANIAIPSNSILQKDIQDYLARNQDLTLNDAISVIQNFILDQGIKKGFCESIKNVLAMDIPGEDFINLDKCDETYIKISRGDMTYLFKFDNSRLINFKITDSLIDTLVHKTIDGQIIIKDKFPSLLKSILSYDSQNMSSDINVNDIININNRFNKYFGILPDDIKAIDKNVYNIKLNLGDIPLVMKINVAQNYMLYDLSIVISSNDSKIDVRGFILNLIDTKLTDINKFKINPLDYIGTIDSGALEQYRQISN